MHGSPRPWAGPIYQTYLISPQGILPLYLTRLAVLCRCCRDEAVAHVLGKGVSERLRIVPFAVKKAEPTASKKAGTAVAR